MDFCMNSTYKEYFSNVSSEGEGDKRNLYKYLCPILIIGCVISVILNAVLVVIGLTKTVNKSPILILSLNLATTDCFASLFVGVGLFVNSYLPTVFGVNMNDFHCVLLVIEIFRLAALIASAMHLLSLALVHYKGIVKPLHYRSVIFCSQHRTRSIHLMSFLCWIIPVIFFIIYFTSISCQGFLSPKCMGNQFMLTRRFRYIIVISFFIPLIIMLFLYIRIFGIIKNHQYNRSLPGSVRGFHQNNIKKIATTQVQEKVLDKEKDNEECSVSDENNAEINNSPMDKYEKKKKPLILNLKWYTKCSCLGYHPQNTTSLNKINAYENSHIRQTSINNSNSNSNNNNNNNSRRNTNTNINSLRTNLTTGTTYRFQPQIYGHTKALITTLLILGTYLLCWMPAVIFFALTCVDGCLYPLLQISFKKRVIFAFITNGLVILKAIVDPFIYTYRMKEMKVALNQYCFRNTNQCSTIQKSGTLTTMRSNSPSSIRQRYLIAETSMIGK